MSQLKDYIAGDSFGSAKISTNTYSSTTLIGTITLDLKVSDLGNITIEDSAVKYIKMPDDITSITNNDTFKNVTGLKNLAYNSTILFRSPVTGMSTITIPTGIKEIGPYACYSTNATDISIPSSVTKFDTGCFYNSTITKVNYAGTMSTWKTYVAAPSKIFNTNTDAFVYCTDGTLYAKNNTVYKSSEESDVTANTIFTVAYA